MEEDIDKLGVALTMLKSHSLGNPDALRPGHAATILEHISNAGGATPNALALTGFISGSIGDAYKLVDVNPRTCELTVQSRTNPGNQYRVTVTQIAGEV